MPSPPDLAASWEPLPHLEPAGGHVAPSHASYRAKVPGGWLVAVWSFAGGSWGLVPPMPVHARPMSQFPRATLPACYLPGMGESTWDGGVMLVPFHDWDGDGRKMSAR
jgi:hypothetical protein